MNILKITHHVMYLTVLLTFTTMNYSHTDNYTPLEVAKMIANINPEDRLYYLNLLSSIDTAGDKTYCIEVRGRAYNLKTPSVTRVEAELVLGEVGDIPLPCNEQLLNLLEHEPTLVSYLNCYERVRTSFWS